MTRDTNKNESYYLAEQWVVGQIDEELGNCDVHGVATIDAGEMHQCDCVPIDVIDSRGRKWRLSAIVWSGTLSRVRGTLTATYECLK